MRVDFSPDDMGDRDFYKFLTSVVIPRPIAWVSTLSAEGIPNLAPHSFFTVASTNPPIVQFTPTARKDSLNNVEATGEFVVNFASEDLFAEINGTGTNFPAGISEFDAVGLAMEPSLTVRPARVAESPAALECKLDRIIPVGNSWLVLGEVVHAVVNQEMLDGKHPEARRLKP
ncbi:MAG TPA: flavin reductase family protein, partial [Arthrobacter sp.]|nr:flavin reductase family protein [Arthrobacter sp.]